MTIVTAQVKHNTLVYTMYEGRERLGITPETCTRAKSEGEDKAVHAHATVCDLSQ